MHYRHKVCFNSAAGQYNHIFTGEINEQNKRQFGKAITLQQNNRKSPGFLCVCLMTTLPTCGGRCRELILIDGANETVETAHNIINAPYHNPISGVLQEHLKWPLCRNTRCNNSVRNLK